MTIEALKNGCPECGNSHIVYSNDKSERFCEECGYVINDRGVSLESHIRRTNYDGLEIGHNYPTSASIHDNGLSTVIGRSEKDASGRPIPPQSRSSMERLRMWDGRSKRHTPKDVSLHRAFSYIEGLSERLGSPDTIRDDACYMYRKALYNGLTKGRNLKTLGAACLYEVYRKTESPRTLNEIAKASNIKRKEIARAYRFLIKKLDLTLPVTDISKFVSKIGSMVQLSERTKRRATEIARNCPETGGKDPSSLAASALYLASIETGETRRQKEIAEAAGITGVTLRNHIKTLKPYM